jgi:hypothetical protein
MTPEGFGFKNKASRFISGASSGIRSGSFGMPIVRRISLIPKRSIPQQIVDRLQTSASSETDEGIETSRSGVSSLGKITLNLEQTKNNLERIVQVISEDYKNTQDQNKKEVEEYRKRIANRGRIFGKKELGDKKTDILGGIRKYAGSFFSGAGGAIRGLAMFNLLQGILSGDPSKIIGPLLGIGVTYLPAIGAVIGLSVAKSIGKRLLGLGKVSAAAPGVASAAGAGGSALGRFGRFAGKAGLVAGGIGLASSLFNNGREGDQTQQRLEDLTQQQKGLVEPGNLVSMPQDDLKRFEALNNKFEKALDFLLAKQKESEARRPSSGGGGGGGGGPAPGPVDPNITNMSSLTGIHKQAADIIAGYESATSGGYNAMNRGTGGDSPEGAKHYFGKNLTEMSISEVMDLQSQRGTLNAAGRYQFVGNTLPSAMKAAGLKPTDKFNEINQDKMFVGLLKERGGQPWTGPWGLGKYSQEQLDIIERARRTPVAPVLPQTYPSMSSAIIEESVIDPSPVMRRSLPTPAASTPIIVPMPVPQQAVSQPTSFASEGNDIVPAFSTTYPENFLALYSKLIYQIV